MSTIAIVLFFLGLLLVILIHELGHYLVGRVFGFRILEYFVGFGPRLWSFTKGGIEYGVKALPLGGYVKIAGMNPFVNDVPEGDESRSYGAKPVWQRALTIAAGPLSHLLVAFVLFGAVAASVGDMRVDYHISAVDRTLGDGSDSPAALAGVRPGDQVLAIGDVEDPDAATFGRLITDRVGEPVPFTFDRDGVVVTTLITPARDCLGGRWGGVTGMAVAGGAPATITEVAGEIRPGQPAPAATAGLLAGDMIVAIDGVGGPTGQQVQEIFARSTDERVPVEVTRSGAPLAFTVTPVRGCVGGSEVARIGVQLGPVPLPLGSAVGVGVSNVALSAKESFVSITRVFGPEGVTRVFSLLFGDAERRAEDPTSVVGIGQQVGEIGGEGDWATIAFFLGYVTVFIGLINLVPLPPFDGGHLLLLAIEKVRRRQVDLRRVVPVSAVVMGFLVTFVIATVIVDITKPLPPP